METKKISQEYSKAYESEINNYNQIILLSFGLTIITMALLYVLVTINNIAGIINCVIMLILLSVLLLYYLKKRNNYRKDKNELIVTI